MIGNIFTKGDMLHVWHVTRGRLHARAARMARYTWQDTNTCWLEDLLTLPSSLPGYSRRLVGILLLVKKKNMFEQRITYWDLWTDLWTDPFRPKTPIRKTKLGIRPNPTATPT